MRYLVWILRLVVFVIVLLFALKNTGPVDVGFFADQVIPQVPLIVVMLSAFVLGVLFGLLMAAMALLRRRREVHRLRREAARLRAELSGRPAAGAASSEPVSAASLSETATPLAPL
ncbi:lipopolysaccharide assembly LapA domain-containing protein [Castellaniella sp.]|uniref:LapA family protein n=1 Tax=Castellaniella sp. TaxID=1955812 RepID=UPI003560C61B